MAHADRPHIKVTSLSLLQCALPHNCVAFGNEKKYEYDSDMTHDGEDQNAEVEDGVTQFLFLFLFCSAPPIFPSRAEREAEHVRIEKYCELKCGVYSVLGVFLLEFANSQSDVNMIGP